MKKITLTILSIYLIIAAYIGLPDHNLYDSKRIIQMGIFVIVGVLVIASLILKKGHSFAFNDLSLIDKRTKVVILILLFFGLTSSLLSNYPTYAFLEVIYWALLILLALLLSPVYLREHYFLGRLIFLTVFLYSGLYLIIFIGNYISSFFDPMILIWPNKYDFTIIYEGIEYQGKEILFFVNSRFFNHTQTWTLPVLIGFLCLQNRESNNKVLSSIIFMLISFWWMLIFASGGRGTGIALLISLLAIFLIWGRSVLKFVRAAFSTLVCGGVLYFLLFQVVPEKTTIPSLLHTSDSGRLDLWFLAIKQWMEAPILGTGPMHFAELINEVHHAHPHNFFIQVLSEWGLIAFLAFLVVLGLGLFFVKNKFNEFKPESRNQFVYISFTWSLLAALIHSLVSGIMHTPMSQLWLILILTWFFGYKVRSMKPAKLTYHVPAYTYIVALFIVIALVWNDLFSLQEMYQSYVENYPDTQSFPRFWGQGLFPIESDFINPP